MSLQYHCFTTLSFSFCTLSQALGRMKLWQALVCEALAGSGAWLRSWTVWLVISGKALSFSESPLHLSDGHYINSYSDLKMYCLGQNALL